MILCWAAFTAIVDCTQPMGHTQVGHPWKGNHTPLIGKILLRRQGASPLRQGAET